MPERDSRGSADRRRPERERERERPEREHRPSGRRSTDQDALSLRAEGYSFAAIASKLRLKRSKDAYASFHRGLDARPPEERSALARDELVRLDALEVRIRDRDAANPERMEHRLAALETMRRALG